MTPIVFIGITEWWRGHSHKEEKSVEGKITRSGLHLLFVGPVRFYLGVLSELRSGWLTTKFLAVVQGLEATRVLGMGEIIWRVCHTRRGNLIAGRGKEEICRAKSKRRAGQQARRKPSPTLLLKSRLFVDGECEWLTAWPASERAGHSRKYERCILVPAGATGQENRRYPRVSKE